MKIISNDIVSVIKDISTIDNQSRVIYNNATNACIANIEQQQQASKLLAFATSCLKQLESKRKSLVQPLNDTITKINSEFKGSMDILNQAKTILSKKMAVFEQAENDRIAKEKQIQIEIAEAKKSELEEQAIKSIKSGSRAETIALLRQKDLVVAKNVYETAQVEGFHIKKVWKARVVDKAIVPELFKIVDMIALNKLATVTKGVYPVQGIEFYQDTLGVSR